MVFSKRAMLLTTLLVGCPDPTPLVEPLDVGPMPEPETTTTATQARAPTPPTPTGSGRVHLPIDAKRLGIVRANPQLVRQGPSAEDPAVATTSDGRVFVAFSVRTGGKEHIAVRRGKRPGAPLSPPRRWSDGDRAWRPRLAVTKKDEVWLAWCGRRGPKPADNHRRGIFLKRIAPPTPGPSREISPPISSPKDGRRYCDPDMIPAADGGLHLVWEASRETSALTAHIAYRKVGADGKLGPIEMVSSGRFDRRPAVAETKSGSLVVAWDRLVDTFPTGAPDPDYDVFLRTRTSSKSWGPVRTIDARDGIQAAPRLAPSGDDVLITYHSSHRHSLVKWWTVRRVTMDGNISVLSSTDQAELLLPGGQQQGAELPTINVHESGRILLATRVSHGAYLHIIDGSGVMPALDLTRRGWGARGLRMDSTFAADGSLLVARRARHDVILERFIIQGPGRGPPKFVPAPIDRPKTIREKVEGPVRLGSDLSPLLDGAKVLFGDVHMHSGVSDGTGPPDEIYARAYARGLDFAVLTDHDGVVGAKMMLSEHDEIRWLTDVFNTRSGFTALHAYEWTSFPYPRGSGHRNVYFKGYGPTPLAAARGRAPDTRALYRMLQGHDVFTAPHHTGWTGTDWNNADPRIQRHVEIVSVHGAFEDPNTQPIPTRAAKKGMFAVDGLKRGVKFGFIGGSDAHGILWHHGVGRRMDPWGHGLTGVVADRNEREAVWNALYARRTFATSGAPITALAAIGGAVVGGATKVQGKVELRFFCRGSMRLNELAIVRDGVLVHRRATSSDFVSGTWVDDKVQPGEHSYYVRVDQGSGIEETDVAWSSPIFVTVSR